MCLPWAPQQSEGAGTSTAGSHRTPQRIRFSSGCLCQWLCCDLWHHHPERCWCQQSQPRPWQGTGTDCRGVREQAEAVTIENKDFIFFFFPVDRTVPITQTKSSAASSAQGSPLSCCRGVPARAAARCGNPAAFHELQHGHLPLQALGGRKY